MSRLRRALLFEHTKQITFFDTITKQSIQITFRGTTRQITRLLHNRHFIAEFRVYPSFNKQIKCVGLYRYTFSFIPSISQNDNNIPSSCESHLFCQRSGPWSLLSRTVWENLPADRIRFVLKLF